MAPKYCTTIALFGHQKAKKNRCTGSTYQIGTSLSNCFLVSSFACSGVLGPAEVVAPVPDVEEEEGEGEDDPGEDVNLLGLELEVPVPDGQEILPPGWGTVVDDGAGGQHLAALDTPHQGVLGRQAGRWTAMSIREEEGHSCKKTRY